MNSGGKSPTWMPALDGLRGIAVLMVVLVHGGLAIRQHATGSEQDLWAATAPLWSLGRSGVQLFFVLSGFLLFLPYARATWSDKPWPSTGQFYVNRLRRIGPAYWATLALFGIVFGAAWWDVALHAVFLHNATPETFRSINDVFWSMAVEVQFYVALPLIARLVQRYRWRALIALVSFSPALEAGLATLRALAGMPDEPSRSILAMPLAIGVFAAGMSIAALTVAQPCSVAPRVWQVCGLGLLLAAAGFDLARPHLPGLARLAGGIVAQTAWGLGFAAVLWIALTSPRLGRALAIRPLVFVGVISYSVYIWHVPLLGLTPNGPSTTAVTALFGLCVGLPVCWLSYRMLERPFHRRRVARPVADEQTTVCTAT